ncbi:MAG: CTP-dependent riboflavin kinase [Candidatus Bathyarchaeota archaeon]|nr:CTP-dependent riboflavin kinase [Candidatus Bathyarchaeota archaeon]
MNPLTFDKDLENFFFTLYKLAEMGARNRTIKTSTKFLAEKLGLSQQTVSRRLIELERKGWIQRTSTRDGSLIRISESGDTQLRKVRCGLNTVFEEKRPLSVTIEGVVFSGLREGAYYVTRDPYRRQFIEKLGFDPYPGTLNLKINSEYDARIREELETYPGIEITGFQNKDRTYGSVKCFRAAINNKEKGAVVLALRTHYDSSVIEVIAPFFLRGRLKLKDGNKVKVEIFPADS